MSKVQQHAAVVLLVEDDRDDQALTMKAFEKSKLRNKLFIVEDGEQALDYLHHRGAYATPGDAPRPDIILLDLNLPRIDGREVLEHIKSDAELRSIPVIVLTTSSQEEDIVRSYDLGVNSFITKPVGLDQFVRAIKTLKRYWLELVVLPPNSDE